MASNHGEINEKGINLLPSIMTVSNAIQEDGDKAETLSHLYHVIAQLKEELCEEKKKSKDEAEDLIQEMAELRYQLMEMLEHERDLRVSTEKASLKRVQELESQIEEQKRKFEMATNNRIDSQNNAASKDKEMEKLKLSVRKLENELQHSLDREASLQSVCSKLSSQVEFLQAKLAVAEQEIHTNMEQHIEVLIRYEEEHSSMREETDALRSRLENELAKAHKALAQAIEENEILRNKLSAFPGTSCEYHRIGSSTGACDGILNLYENQLGPKSQKNSVSVNSCLEKALNKLAIAESEIDFSKTNTKCLVPSQHGDEQFHFLKFDKEGLFYNKIKHMMTEKEEKIIAQREDLNYQTAHNDILLDDVGALAFEVQSLQNNLLASEALLAEIRLKLEKAEKAKSLGQEMISRLQCELKNKDSRISSQNEKLVQSELRFNHLHRKYTALQDEIAMSQNKFRNSESLIQRLSFELSLAKEEMVKSEGRIQRLLNEAKESSFSTREQNGG